MGGTVIDDPEHTPCVIIRRARHFPIRGRTDPGGVQLCQRIGVARKDPTAVIPQPNSVLMQPTPNGAATNGSHQTGLTDLPRQILGAPARQGKVVGSWQFASPRFNLDDEVWGKKSGGDPDALVPPIPSDDPKRNVSASGRLPHGEYPNDRQSRRCSIPRRLTRPSWHAGHENTVTYICRLSAAIPTSRQTTSESQMGSISAWRGACLNHVTKSPLNSR
jgi:hypothetical protein